MLRKENERERTCRLKKQTEELKEKKTRRFITSPCARDLTDHKLPPDKIPLAVLTDTGGSCKSILEMPPALSQSEVSSSSVRSIHAVQTRNSKMK